MKTVAKLLVECLENENVKYIFGIPGEENLDLMDALRTSSIKFIAVRHEQAAAFMADVYGRLTNKTGVCLATLGPGATNLITGVADANLDNAPVVAIAGQGSTTRLHKESHQIIDLVNLFEPITKYAVEIYHRSITPEAVRKAFKDSRAGKPGACFISLPENIAKLEVGNEVSPLKPQNPFASSPAPYKIRQAADIISQAKKPLILAGNGVIRSNSHKALVKFAEKLNIPVTQTFMAKGCIPFSHPLCMGSVGLQARDYIACGFDRADVIICIGFDMVEYHPNLWHPGRDKKIIHIDFSYAEVDSHYVLECGVLGNIAESLEKISELAQPATEHSYKNLKNYIVKELDDWADDNSFPLKPQKIIYDTREALNDDDILISDVGAHKMWIARLFHCEKPNTCIISNGFASMGIGVPGAIAAKLIHPEHNIMTITGDGGFMMNSQEIETALRLKLGLVIMIWHDKEYGLIRWHQERRFGHYNHISFNNPDFIKYAESFGAKAYRINSADELLPAIRQAFADNTVVVIDVPVDYSENMELTGKLGKLVCPV